MVAIDQRRRDVGAVLGCAPGNEFIAGRAVRKRDVATGAGTNGIHRRLAAMGVGDEYEPVSSERSWNRVVPSTTKLPYFLSVFEIVGSDERPAIGYDLSVSARTVHIWSAPASFTEPFAGSAPDLPAILQPKGGQKRRVRRIARKYDTVAMQSGRAAKAPADSILADIDNSEVLLPEQRPREIIAVEPFRAEKRDHSAPVGCEGGVGVRRFFVALRPR